MTMCETLASRVPWRALACATLLALPAPAPAQDLPDFSGIAGNPYSEAQERLDVDELLELGSRLVTVEETTRALPDPVLVLDLLRERSVTRRNMYGTDDDLYRYSSGLAEHIQDFQDRLEAWAHGEAPRGPPPETEALRLLAENFARTSWGLRYPNAKIFRSYLEDAEEAIAELSAATD